MDMVRSIMAGLSVLGYTSESEGAGMMTRLLPILVGVVVTVIFVMVKRRATPPGGGGGGLFEAMMGGGLDRVNQSVGERLVAMAPAGCQEITATLAAGKPSEIRAGQTSLVADAAFERAAVDMLNAMPGCSGLQVTATEKPDGSWGVSVRPQG